MKKLISAVCAAAMMLTAFSGICVHAESAEVYETIFEDNFDNGISSVTDEGEVGGSQISAADGSLQFGNSSILVLPITNRIHPRMRIRLSSHLTRRLKN